MTLVVGFPDNLGHSILGDPAQGRQGAVSRWHGFIISLRTITDSVTVCWQVSALLTTSDFRIKFLVAAHCATASLTPA